MQQIAQNNKGASVNALENYFRTKLNVMAIVYVTLIAVAVYSQNV